MTAADATNLQGGHMGVAGTAVLFGKELDTKRTTEIHCPIHFYEASITAQAIISYAWLAEQNLMVNPRRNSLYFQDTQICVTIQGMTPDDELKPPPGSTEWWQSNW